MNAERVRGHGQQRAARTHQGTAQLRQVGTLDDGAAAILLAVSAIGPALLVRRHGEALDS